MSCLASRLRAGQLGLLILGVAIAFPSQPALSHRLWLFGADFPGSSGSGLAYGAVPHLSPNPALFTPSFPSFNSQPLDLQIRLYNRYLLTNGVPDVLVVGSSRALQGVDPAALQQSLAARGYPNLRIYNFSINGATAQVVDLMLQQILPPDQFPRLLIWADGSRAFNSAKLDVTYNGILASAGYTQIRRGRRPIQSRSLEVLPTPTPEICIDLPVVPAAQASSSPMAQAQINLAQFKPINSAFGLTSWQTRPNPLMDREPVLLAASNFACSPSKPSTSIPTRVPQSYSLLSVEQSSPSPIDSNGFQFISAQFDPATYYRQFPRVAGQYDNNYVPFRLGGEQTTATVAIASFTRRHRIPLIFVNLPLTQEYLDPVRQRFEQQFRQHMQQLAIEQTFLFRDLSQYWLTQNQYFADPSHLNGQGARALSIYLGSDAGIPWATLLR